MYLFISAFRKCFYIFYIALLFNSCDAAAIKNLPDSNMQKYIDADNDFSNIKIVDEIGKSISLKELCENIVIIVFSAVWCPNCPEILQKFDNLLNKIKEKGIKDIKIIVLNVGKENVNEIKMHYKINDIQILDVYQSVNSNAMKGIAGVPACLIFNTKGKLVWGYLGGGIDFSSDKFLNAIIKLRE